MSDPVSQAKTTLADLRVVCSRCGGSGAIETSQLEDAKFSYQDQCPDCSSWGVVPATLLQLVDALRELGAERMAVSSDPESQLVNFPPGSYLVVPLSNLEEQT